MDQEIQEIPEKEQHFKKAWLFFLVEGIIAASMGLVLLIWPGAGLTFTAVVIGIALAADGISRLINSFYFLSGERRDLFIINLIRGLLQIILGAFIVTNPSGAGKVGAGFLLTLAGIFIIVWTVIDLLKNKTQSGSLKFRVENIIFLLFGAVLIAVPVFSANILLRIIGLIAAAGGGFTIYMAFRIKRQIVPSDQSL